MRLDARTELVIAADIARRLGVSKQRVGVLARQSGFPSPVGALGRSQVWRWSSVEGWAIRTGRLDGHHPTTSAKRGRANPARVWDG